MTQALAEWQYDQKEFDIYRRHFAPPTTTDDEWEIFLEVCRSYRISPIRRQIYLVGRWDSVKKRTVNVPQVSIGTLRLMALRTHEFEGTTEPQWGDEEGNWYTCWPKAKGKHPYCARVGVWRKNFRAPAWGIVYFHELAQYTDVWEGGHKTGQKRLTSFWEDKGIHQIIKCAEADGLRKAFEEECGGVYIHEEMLQADADQPVVTVIPDVDSDPDADESLKETAKAKVSISPDAATEQQLSSIRNLCNLLNKPEPENIATLKSDDAKKIIREMGAELQEQKRKKASPASVAQQDTTDQAVVESAAPQNDGIPASAQPLADIPTAAQLRKEIEALALKYEDVLGKAFKKHIDQGHYTVQTLINKGDDLPPKFCSHLAEYWQKEAVKLALSKAKERVDFLDMVWEDVVRDAHPNRIFVEPNATLEEIIAINAMITLYEQRKLVPAVSGK